MEIHHFHFLILNMSKANDKIVISKNAHIIYIGAILTLLVILFIATYEPQEKVETKKRNETKLGSCEILKICDYRQTMCMSMHCPREYSCWEEKQNCDFGKAGLWDLWFKYN